MKKLVLCALLAGLASVPGQGYANEVDAQAATWSSLDVPYLHFREGARRRVTPKLRFRGTQVAYPFRDGILTMAATADSAIVMKNDYCYGGCTIQNGHGEFFEGPLLEVAADGTTGRVEKRSFGIPLADPLGHVAFWTKREKRRLRLIGYDTRTHTKVLGPTLSRSAAVFAVAGDTAYVVGDKFSGSTNAARWTPGDPALTSVAMPPAADPDQGRLLMDVSQDRVLSVDFSDEESPSVLSDLEGNVIGGVPVGFGTFSPDGRFLSELGNRRVQVYDVDASSFVTLSVGKKWRSTDSRWAPDGRLVLTATKRGGGYDDANTVKRFACTLPAGQCAALPGRSALYWEQTLENSAFGQFLAALLPYISRTSGPYARQMRASVARSGRW
jgi:hypothetical protein